MKNWFEISFNEVLFFALFLLIALNVFSAISEVNVVLEFVKPLFIPVFLICYLIKNKLSNVVFVLFLMASFFGDVVPVLLESASVEKTSNGMYFISYLCLIFMIATNFKWGKIDKVIGAYLLLIFLINSYFLFTLYSVLKTIISDNTEVLLFGLKSAAVIILLFVSFGVYLTKESKRSILFLMLSLCLFFSDVFNYINIYYVYDWRFAMLDGALHAVGIFFLFNYIIEANKITEKEAAKEVLTPSQKAMA